MTTQQFYWLRWLAKHGGRGRLERHELIAVDGSPSGGQAVIAFLHLVAQGAIAGTGTGGELFITEYGQRCIERSETEQLPLEPPG